MLALYRAVAVVGGPLIRLFLSRRRARGKEDAVRYNERFGIAGRARPEGPLVWVHAASVGEAVSVLSLIDRLLKEYRGTTVLMTTGTVTSAQIMADRLPDGVIHQFVPVDRPDWVDRFLDHWRPDLALWLESEFWPNLLLAIDARGIPLVLVNARISPSSFRGWRRLPRTIARLLRCFDLCLAQTDDDRDRLIALGARVVTAPGNLKFAAPALPVDQSALAAMMERIGQRPVWVAASTHEGEDGVVLDAHRALAVRRPDLLTVIVPRHPVRGSAIETLCAESGLRPARRSIGGSITADTEIYIADTVGELGLFYRLAPVAFIGGTLVAHGGQNLLEAAKLGSAIVHGPDMANFAKTADEMHTAGATEIIEDAAGLATAIDALLSDDALLAARVAAAAGIADGRDGILDEVLAQIAPYLPPPGAPRDRAGKTARRHASA